MARKKTREEEIVEMLYQWHIGSTISQVKRYLEIDRKTISKYIKQAEIYGFSRDLEVHHYN
jgi:predicted transcriptional regulator YheO